MIWWCDRFDTSVHTGLKIEKLREAVEEMMDDIPPEDVVEFMEVWTGSVYCSIANYWKYVQDFVDELTETFAMDEKDVGDLRLYTSRAIFPRIFDRCFNHQASLNVADEAVYRENRAKASSHRKELVLFYSLFVFLDPEVSPSAARPNFGAILWRQGRSPFWVSDWCSGEFDLLSSKGLQGSGFLETFVLRWCPGSALPTWWWWSTTRWSAFIGQSRLSALKAMSSVRMICSLSCSTWRYR